MKVTISGFDGLTKRLEDAQKAFSQLDGDICKVNFNAHDPSSIDAAIRAMELEIDRRVGAYADNPLVVPVVAEAKAKYRQAILDKAAESRAAEEVNETARG